ncbi:MAG TPA: hypothetical protein VN903_33370 [Polyangia bacterium]|jgi:hypothetical protein|nr:hypothetical protein [Polyangia bacterium]
MSAQRRRFAFSLKPTEIISQSLAGTRFVSRFSIVTAVSFFVGAIVNKIYSARNWGMSIPVADPPTPPSAADIDSIGLHARARDFCRDAGAAGFAVCRGEEEEEAGEAQDARRQQQVEVGGAC